MDTPKLKPCELKPCKCGDCGRPAPGHRDGVSVSASPRPWRVEDSIIVDSDGCAIAAMCEPDCTGDAALIVEAVNERDRLRDLVRRMIPSVAASLAVSKAEGEALDRWLALIREACEAVEEREDGAR